MTLNCGPLPCLALLSHTVLFAPAHTTARSTVLAQTRQDRSSETDLSASDLTGPLGALQVLACSHTFDAAAGPLPTPSSTALTASQGPLNATIPLPVLANAARDKVQLLAKQGSPDVTTPINVDVLEREFLGHPDRNFVDTLINCLRYGTHVGYTGPNKPRVSRNLISTNQHPDIVTSNLNKEISLGRVAGPFISSPLPNRPFLSSRMSPLQRESKCEVFVMVISSTLHMNEN